MSINGFHHTGIVTRDLDGLQRRYESFGFTLSPRSRHLLSPGPGQPPVPGCTANLCALFGDSYIELLGIVDDSAPDPWHTRSMGAGFRILNLDTGDADATHRALSAAGLRTSGVLELEREVATAEGPRTMRARAVHLDPASTPEGYLGLAQHLTREYVHQPRYLTHPNGARGLGSVLIVCAAAEFDGIVDRYARITGSSPQVEGPLTMLETGSARLEFVELAKAGDVLAEEPITEGSHLAAMTVLVDDADKARELVEDAGTPTVPIADGFYVRARDAYGAGLFFAG
ncbi:VOC family protein [Nocardia huaxiensis]|uniref:VOC family protein n=1 Tax=Nocardia huaxiensis TaxID=2755382 RepID=A0A7D6V6R5_9NOCA|nr:VOC family protein [Nocardia huaxiensis]QLY28014.1 VOC family protein [Nocardia huaxiensis]